jgi:hypothetical protein
MIDPKAEDVGRLVLYTGNRGWNGPEEEGVITSFNDSCVFVRYHGKLHAQGTSREDLEWSLKK